MLWHDNYQHIFVVKALGCVLCRLQGDLDNLYRTDTTRAQ